MPNSMFSTCETVFNMWKQTTIGFSIANHIPMILGLAIKPHGQTLNVAGEQHLAKSTLCLSLLPHTHPYCLTDHSGVLATMRRH